MPASIRTQEEPRLDLVPPGFRRHLSYLTGLSVTELRTNHKRERVYWLGDLSSRFTLSTGKSRKHAHAVPFDPSRIIRDTHRIITTCLDRHENVISKL